MAKNPKHAAPTTLIAEWTLPAEVTLGSSVRARGILLELRAHLAGPDKKHLDIIGNVLTLRAPDGLEEQARVIAGQVAAALGTMANLPVIPREIEDILAISTTERHRWLKDGRLSSAGTRTVKLRGRAKKITFHVFDPRRVEDILNDDLVSAWREADVITAAENRRRAAWNRRLARAEKAASADTAQDRVGGANERPQLVGWEEFEREGLLR